MPRVSVRWLAVCLFVASFIVFVLGGRAVEAQRLHVSAGGGWAFPTNNLDLESTFTGSDGTPLLLTVDLNAGPHVYAGAGFVRSIGENFELGARLRGHGSQIRSDARCGRFDCRNPEGTLLVGTLEGRIILTSPGWIHPYLLVGLGVVHTSLDAVTVRNVDIQGAPETLTFPEVSVVDAGGDVGVGASIPVVKGLYVDAEIRATGSLPGGKENAVTMVPFSIGLSYGFK